MKTKKLVKILSLALFSVALFGITAFAAEGDAAAVASAAGIAEGLSMLGAALSTGLACIGCGIAVGPSAAAAIGAMTEDPSTFGRSLIFVALGEGIALYGMLISILIIYA